MNAKKIVTAGLALVMVAGISVAGTLAYLTSTTGEVKNTFTVGSISMELKEEKVTKADGVWTEGTDLVTENRYENIYPGAELPKTPVVTIKAGSEPCYVYVCVENPFDAESVAVTYNEDWSAIETSGDKTVYKYKEIVDANSADVVLTGAPMTQVTISEDVTDMTDLAGDIKVTAYAHQAKANGDDLTTTADAGALEHFIPAEG